MASTKKKDINIDDYKEQIDKYIKERVEREVASESLKIYKKQLRSKTIISLVKTIIIIILILIIGYGMFYLYKDGYFDNKDIIINNDVPVINVDDEKSSIDDLKKEYSFLLDNVIMYDNSNYLKDFYNGNLTNELKEYLAFNLIIKDDINKDNDTIYFKDDVLKESYNKLFDKDIEYVSFNASKVDYKYIKLMNAFVGDGKEEVGNKITRDIVDIKVDNDNVVITTIEGLIKDNKLYNILSLNEVKGYNKGDIFKYESSLNKVIYTFKLSGGNYYLDNIK